MTRTHLTIMTAVLSAGAAASAPGQIITSAVIKTGSVISAGRTVNDVEGAASNTAGGYLFRVTSTDGTTEISHLWGNAAVGAGSVLRSSGTVIGPYTLGTFETGFGIDNTGRICYSPNITAGGPVSNADSAFVDNTVLAVKGDPSPNVPGQRWSFASAPKITNSGEGWFVAGLTTSTTSTTSQRRALIRQNSLTPVLIAGQFLPGIADPISDTSSIMFDWSLSPSGQKYIAQVSLNDNPLIDKLIVLNGSPINLGTIASPEYLRAGVTVPVTAGGSGFEVFQAFDSCAVNDSGSWAVTGTFPGHFIMHNGQVWVREGDVVDGNTLTGFILDTRLNSTGDLTFLTKVYDAAFNSYEAIFLNRRLLVRVGQPIDFDNNGVVEPNSVLSDVATTSLAISPRINGVIRVYFAGSVDINQTPADTTDNAHAGMVIRVCLADFNNSGSITVQDIFDFLAAWFAHSPSADFNANGTVTVQDIFDFLAAWFAKCA